VADLRSLDLNLLVAFDMLVTERHVSRAAGQLGLTQPAVSHALRRLRLIFDDELLLRTPGGMVPTLRALELHRSVTAILDAMRELVEGPEQFEAAAARIAFSLGMSDSIAIALLPGLVHQLRAVAPLLRINGVQCSPLEGLQGVIAGELDLAVGYYTDDAPGVNMREISRVQRYFAVVDRKHPLLRDGALDREAYLASPHVAVTLLGSRGKPVDTMLEAMGIKRNIVVVAPSFAAVPAIVRGTDLVGHCGKALVDQLIYREELVLFTPPIPLAQNTLRVVWRRGGPPDAGRRWLIDLIAAVGAAIYQ